MLHSSAPLHHVKFVIFPRGKVSTPCNLYFNTTLHCTRFAFCTSNCLDTFNFSQTSRNRECSLARHGELAKLAPCPRNTNRWLLTTPFQHLCHFHSVSINSSLKLARIKPSQPFMMSSGTSKLPKIVNYKAIFLKNCHLLKSILPPRNMASNVTCMNPNPLPTPPPDTETLMEEIRKYECLTQKRRFLFRFLFDLF